MRLLHLCDLFLELLELHYLHLNTFSNWIYTSQVVFLCFIGTEEVLPKSVKSFHNTERTRARFAERMEARRLLEAGAPTVKTSSGPVKHVFKQSAAAKRMDKGGILVLTLHVNASWTCRNSSSLCEYTTRSSPWRA